MPQNVSHTEAPACSRNLLVPFGASLGLLLVSDARHINRCNVQFLMSVT